MMKDEKKVIEKDRWFNPFWSIWLKHGKAVVQALSLPQERLFPQLRRTALHGN